MSKRDLVRRYFDVKFAPFSRACRLAITAAVLLLPGITIASEKADGNQPAADAIIEKAVASADPITALSEGVDLANPRLIESLLAGVERVRKKHGPQKTLAFSSRLVEAARATADDAVLAAALAQHARVLDLAGDYKGAVAVGTEAALLFDRVGKPGEAALARNDAGSVLEQQGELAAAGELLRTSREQGWEHWTVKQRLTALLREGIVARVLGRPREAIRINQEALSIARENGDKESEARILNNLALIHQNLAEYREAIRFGKESLDLRAPTDHQGRAISLTNLGNIHEAQGDKEEAFRTYRAAAAEAEKTKEPKGVAITAVNVGIQLRKMQRAKEARPHLEEGLRIAEEIGFARLRAGARRELGLVLIAVDEKEGGLKLLAEALAEAEKLGSGVDLAETQLALALNAPDDRKASAERALKLARDAQQPEFEWAALTLLGDLDREGDAPAAAIEKYTSAVSVIERIRRQIAGGDVQRQTFFADKLRPYHALVELHFAAGDLPQAFHWIQQAKARVLLDSLALERRQVSTAAPAEQNDRIKALQLKVAEAEAAKEKAAANAARIELDRLVAETAAPGLLTPVANPEELQSNLLDPETGLLEYLVLPERTLLAVLTIEGSDPVLKIHSVDITAAGLRRQVEELRAALATRQLGYEAIAKRLWQRLVGPAGSQLQNRRRLIVAPSGSLWQLPFQVLRDEGDRFLIDRFAITYAPSASSLLQMNTAAKERAKKKTLVLSNPTRTDSGREFPDLPGASLLTAELPPVYGKEATEILAGEAATEHAVKQRAGEFDIVHCAVHGVFDSTAPLQSHLRLAAGDGEDGLLEAREIMEMRINASLAVLAACETGRGGEDAGEGIIGMSWAFFLARCPAVVASQWKVDSASVSELSLGFHQQLASGLSADAALQKATEALRKNRAYRHPFYWAPLIVIGGGL